MATVLYVDDEPVLRRAVSAWLGRQGVQVHSTWGVAEAIRCLHEHEDVDGVFVDLWLGDGSGFELFDWLLEHRPALAARTVFVTGDIIPSAATLRQFEMIGRPVLIKPFDLVQLDGFVHEWRQGEVLVRAPVAHANAASPPPPENTAASVAPSAP